MQLPMAIVFVIIGLFWVIPNTRGDGPVVLFGVVWTVLAVAAAPYHGASLLGLPIPGPLTAEADTEAGASDPVDFDTALRKLEGLRAEGLISDEEHARKRIEILERPG